MYIHCNVRPLGISNFCLKIVIIVFLIFDSTIYVVTFYVDTYLVSTTCFLFVFKELIAKNNLNTKSK